MYEVFERREVKAESWSARMRAGLLNFMARLASAFFTLTALLSSMITNVTFLVAIHSATRMLTGNVAFPLDRGCCTQLIPENKSMLMEWKRGSGVSKIAWAGQDYKCTLFPLFA